MTKPDAMMEWPKYHPDKYTVDRLDYQARVAAFWEQRCRLAVEALQEGSRLNGVDSDTCEWWLERIGKLPERTDE